MNEDIHSNLGARIRKRREELGVSFRDIVQELQTSSRFLEAVETGDFAVFPAKVYALGFLKKIVKIKILNFPQEERASILQEFETEWEVLDYYKTGKHIPVNSGYEKIARYFYITPRRAWMGLLGISVFFLFLFMGVRVYQFLRPPILFIEEPYAKEIAIADPFIHVKGKAAKESRLTMNGRELKMDELGNFEDTVELIPGLNILEFNLENRFGKISKDVKYVLVN